jgi:altronate dehydratase small subunit
MSGTTDKRVLILSPDDNVAMAKFDIQSGTALEVNGIRIVLDADILIGHKFAFKAVKKGEILVKYGAPIGVATQDITPGEYVHIQNVTSDYIPTYTLDQGHEFLQEAH